MKKAGKILMLIGGIMGIVCAVFGILTFFGLGTAFGFGGLGAAVFGAVIESGQIDPASVSMTAEELAALGQELLVVGGVGIVASIVLFVAGLVDFIISLVGSIIALGANGKKRSKKRYIVAIVFGGLILLFFNMGFLAWLASLLVIVGGILGLSALSKEPKEEPVEDASEVVEVK